MCVLTMPGITYLPVASITMSASGQLPRVALPMREITPSSVRMSGGPAAGTAGPAITIACLISRRFTCLAWTGAFAPERRFAGAGPPVSARIAVRTSAVREADRNMREGIARLDLKALSHFVCPECLKRHAPRNNYCRGTGSLDAAYSLRLQNIAAIHAESFRPDGLRLARGLAAHHPEGLPSNRTRDGL